MFPRGGHNLDVQTTSLRCTPEPQIGWTQDVFGNVVATATFADQSDTLSIISEVVLNMRPAWPIFQIAPSVHSVTSAPVKQTIGKGTSIGCSGWPNSAAIDRGLPSRLPSFGKVFIHRHARSSDYDKRQVPKYPHTLK
jgi:hypothetical protein